MLADGREGSGGEAAAFRGLRATAIRSGGSSSLRN